MGHRGNPNRSVELDVVDCIRKPPQAVFASALVVDEQPRFGRPLNAGVSAFSNSLRKAPPKTIIALAFVIRDGHQHLCLGLSVDRHGLHG